MLQLQISLSSADSLSVFLNPSNKYIVAVNFAAFFSFSWLLAIIIRNWTIALGISSLLSFLWSLVNYYVIIFHGSPLFLSEFANFRTAINVLNHYSLTSSKEIWIIVILFLVNLCFIGLLWTLKSRYFKKTWQSFSKITKTIVFISRLLICACLICLIVLILSKEIIKPKSTMGLHWTYAIKYGYALLVFEDIDNRINSIKEPDNYSPQLISVDGYDLKVDSSSVDVYPDIILILNESFFDIGQYAEIKTDQDYLYDYYHLDNAEYGIAGTPTLGGGTNNTEFELLTSNSMYLLQAGAPFTYLDFSNNKNSIAQQLSEIGYTTAGMHCSVPSNYSRNRVYPLLGFEYVVQGKENYTLNNYGNRPWLDSDNYHDLIKLYETMDSRPRFIYMLTYQNHGGYEQNAGSYDTVHLLDDSISVADQVNEYLTSVSLSAQAFNDLVNYYSNVNRPTIICMLGDHAPSFIADLSPKQSFSEEEALIYQQTVPFVLWSNYITDYKYDYSWVSATDIVSLVKAEGGLPLTIYDQMLLKKHEEFPVFLGTGLCRDKNGNIFEYDFASDDPNNILIQYFYAEYNLLKGGDSYRQELFGGEE